jgi:hypothetical protein
MTAAIEAYKAATTREEAIEAFEVLMEVIASDPDLDDDEDFRSYAEKALNDMGVKITHNSEWPDANSAAA